DILQKQLRGENINAPFEVEIVNKTGKVVPFELNISAITDNGEIKGIQIVARNITERKRAEMIKQMQYNIANAVITVKDLNELFDSIQNELNNVIDAKNLVIALYNEETGMLSANVDRDEKGEIPEWPAEKSLTGYVIRQNRPVLLQKKEILRLHEEGTIELFGTISETWLGVPLKVEGKVLGVVIVQNYNNPDVYDQTSIEIMELAAHELSMFIDWKRSGEKANKLSRAVEQSSVSVMITNREGRIEYVNPFFTELTGYSFEEAKGKNSNILKSGHQSKAFYQELWNTILSGNDWEGEMLNKKKTGEFYWEKAFISPILNSEGTITNFVAIKENITESKKMIEELVAAKEKAQESDNLKTAFLNNISHEIRT
ncbi:MAG: PAS domain S-box protein, partial [Bacteroidales bacterium]|nr:PAS domain S-box protein [Bacteroidales bacterium]